jgi:hypothetical protein
MFPRTAGLSGTTPAVVVATTLKDIPAPAPNHFSGLHKPVVASLDPGDWFAMDMAMGNLAAGITLNNQDPTKEKLDPTIPHPVASFELTGTGEDLSWSCKEFPLMKDRVPKHYLEKLVNTALAKAGQADCLRKIATDSRCRIAVTVGYYGSRDVRTRAFLHQDSSLFTILLYRNTQPIPGPEITVNPQGLDWNWKMMEDPAMPQSVKDQLVAAREALEKLQPGEEEMLAPQIPAHGLVGFLNALCYHTSPYPGSRGIPLARLDKELDEICGDEDEELKTAVRRVMADMPPGTKKLYKPDLLRGGISEVDANALLRCFDAKPLDTVMGAQKNTRHPLTKPHRVLKRQLSEILDSGANPFPQNDEPRSFMYILVNVRDAHETDASDPI